MRVGLFGPATGAITFILLLSCFSFGFLHGLEANSQTKAQLTEELNDELSRDEVIKYEEANAFQKGTADFTMTVIKTAIVAANTGSVIGYQNQGWVSPFWAGLTFKAIMYGLLAVSILYYLQRAIDAVHGVSGS